jgi:hypothetical protein
MTSVNDAYLCASEEGVGLVYVDVIRSGIILHHNRSLGNGDRFAY